MFVVHRLEGAVADESHGDRLHVIVERDDGAFGLHAHAHARAAGVCHALLVVGTTFEVWAMPVDVATDVE